MKHLYLKEDDFVHFYLKKRFLKEANTIIVSPFNREKSNEDKTLLKEYYFEGFRPQILLESFTFGGVDFIVTSIDDDDVSGIMANGKTKCTLGEPFYGNFFDKETHFGMVKDRELSNLRLDLLVDLRFNFRYNI